MESLWQQLGVSGIRRVTTAMFLSLSQGGGKPPPTPSLRATRPPPEPPPVPPGRISSFQIFNTRTFAHPPSTASKFTSFTLSALHLPRIPQFFATRNAPPESQFPPGFVRSLIPQHQGLSSDHHNLFFHFPFSDPPFTLTVCGDHENKAELWAGVCDVRVSTPLFRLKELLAEGDVQIDPICRDLSVFEIASDGIVAAELKEERSLYKLFYSFRGLPNALLLRCSKRTLLSAKDVDSDQSLKWGAQLSFLADLGGLYCISIGIFFYLLIQCEYRVKKLRNEDSVLRAIRNRRKAQDHWYKLRKYVMYTHGCPTMEDNYDKSKKEPGCCGIMLHSIHGSGSSRKRRQQSRTSSISLNKKPNLPANKNVRVVLKWTCLMFRRISKICTSITQC